MGKMVEEFNFSDLGSDPKEEIKAEKLSKGQILAKEIAEKFNKTEDEIRELVKKVKEELRGLVSDEGALFIVKKNLEEKYGKPKQNTIEVAEIKEVAEDLLNTTLPSMPSKQEVNEKQKQLGGIVPLNKSSAYPLEPIKIDKNKVDLTEAKAQIIEQIELYNFTIESILTENDFYYDKKNQKRILKCGVRKFQLALNISTEIIEEKFWKEGDQWVAKYKVRAIAPNGRYAEAIGVCEQFEKERARTLHDTLATAQTRATSRAILDLVGWGAVSKEEIDDSEVDSDLIVEPI